MQTSTTCRVVELSGQSSDLPARVKKVWDAGTTCKLQTHIWLRDTLSTSFSAADTTACTTVRAPPTSGAAVNWKDPHPARRMVAMIKRTKQSSGPSHLDTWARFSPWPGTSSPTTAGCPGDGRPTLRQTDPGPFGLAASVRRTTNPRTTGDIIVSIVATLLRGDKDLGSRLRSRL
jgi:hypothetical protein